MIRSYGAAHGTEQSATRPVVEVGSDVRFCFVLEPAGSASPPSEMTEDNDSSQPFHLNEDGTVTVGDVTEDMDFTAERLTRELMQ